MDVSVVKVKEETMKTSNKEFKFKNPEEKYQFDKLYHIRKFIKDILNLKDVDINNLNNSDSAVIDEYVMHGCVASMYFNNLLEEYFDNCECDEDSDECEECECDEDCNECDSPCRCEDNNPRLNANIVVYPNNTIHTIAENTRKILKENRNIDISLAEAIPTIVYEFVRSAIQVLDEEDTLNISANDICHEPKYIFDLINLVELFRPVFNMNDIADNQEINIRMTGEEYKKIKRIIDTYNTDSKDKSNT